jgi:O-antigen/teichoic acid export membrane protein
MNSRLAVNASLNVLTGLSSAGFALIVPVLLSHRIEPAELSIWSIILQSSAYVAPFTFGIQSVLSRHIAVAQERAISGQCESLCAMAVALRMLLYAAICYLFLGLTAALVLDLIYPSLPADRLTTARLAFGIYIVGQASLIPAAGLAGYFYGLQRNIVVTLNVVSSKLLAGVAIVVGTGSLGLLAASGLAAAVTATFSMALYRQYMTTAAVTSRGGPSYEEKSKIQAQLIRECMPISVWAVATFLIYGGSTSVASLVDFSAFPAYALASGMSMLLLGLHSAAFGPFIAHVAVVAERGGGEAIGRALLQASIVSALISVTTVAAFALFGATAVRVFVPDHYNSNVMQLLPILLIGNTVRLIGLPYSNTLIALGMQSKILWTPVIEAGATLGAAIALSGHYGLVGVAWSITIGGVISTLAHLGANMRVTQVAIPAARRTLLAAAGPVLVAWLIFAHLDRSFWIL